ncbi:hypothetical protein ACLMJK_000497 [Lecanora helva]
MHVSCPLLALLGYFSLTAAQDPIFQWDCTNSPESCQNYCFAAFCGGKPGPYTRAIGDRANNRRLSGVTPNTPCTQRRTTWANDAENRYGVGRIDCDEWPPFSVEQGGTGAFLRCVDLSDNRSGGGQLSGFYAYHPGRFDFNIVAQNADLGPNSFCAAPPNCDSPDRGKEFQFLNDQYVNARNLIKRYRPAEVVERITPPRFLTSRGDIVVGLVHPDRDHGIMEGSVVHDAEGGNLTIVKRL